MFTNNNAWNSPVRTISAKVELLEGSTLVKTFTGTDSIKSFTVERIGDTSKFFGYGITQKLNLHLIDTEGNLSFSTSQSLKCYLKTNGDYFTPFPTFRITEVHRDENTNELSITAYDALYWAAAHTISEVNTTMPYSIARLCSRIIPEIGISKYSMWYAGNSAAMEVNLPSAPNFEGTETLREVLDACAEAAHSIYYLDRDTFVLRQFNSDTNYTNPLLTITKEDYFNLDTKTNRRLSDICSATTLGDNVITESGTIGTIQYLRDNPLLELREDLPQVLNTMLAAVGGLTVNQFDCSWRGNPGLEPGDWISIETKEGTYVKSYVVDDVIEYDGTLKQHTKWSYQGNDLESVDNPVSLGDALKQTYAKVDKANKEIELVASDVSATKEEVAGIKIDTQNISISVQTLSENTSKQLEEVEKDFQEQNEIILGLDKDIDNNTESIANLALTNNDISANVIKISDSLKESMDAVNKNFATLTEQVSTKMSENDVTISIQKALENGIDRVTTTTGFTFNEEGLHVNKSGSEITTTITEDGMTVYRDNNEVLVADNLGVKAEDLHATTFLIIGSNSRFEDYDADSRTGCFWIGK